MNKAELLALTRQANEVIATLNGKEAEMAEKMAEKEEKVLDAIKADVEEWADLVETVGLPSFFMKLGDLPGEKACTFSVTPGGSAYNWARLGYFASSYASIQRYGLFRIRTDDPYKWIGMERTPGKEVKENLIKNWGDYRIKIEDELEKKIREYHSEQIEKALRCINNDAELLAASESILGEVTE